MNRNPGSKSIPPELARSCTDTDTTTRTTDTSKQKRTRKKRAEQGRRRDKKQTTTDNKQSPRGGPSHTRRTHDFGSIGLKSRLEAIAAVSPNGTRNCLNHLGVRLPLPDALKTERSAR